jgi:hypothetical protein
MPKEPTENQKKKKDLMDDYELVINSVKTDPKEFFPTADDIPGLGDNVQVYDYESDLEKYIGKSRSMIVEVVKMHLGEDALNNQLVIDKMEEDIEGYAYLKFMVEQSKRLYVSGMTKLDNGDDSARMIEVVGNLQKDMRDNIKSLSIKFKEIETNYRSMKEMFMAIMTPEDSVEQDKTNILNMKEMNNLLDEFVKDRNIKRQQEKEDASDKAEMLQREQGDFIEPVQSEEEMENGEASDDE